MPAFFLSSVHARLRPNRSEPPSTEPFAKCRYVPPEWRQQKIRAFACRDAVFLLWRRGTYFLGVLRNRACLSRSSSGRVQDLDDRDRVSWSVQCEAGSDPIESLEDTQDAGLGCYAVTASS